MVRVLCPIKCLSFYKESILFIAMEPLTKPHMEKKNIMNGLSSVISDKKSSHISILKAIFLLDGRSQTHITEDST